MKKNPQQLFLEVADVFNITVDYNIDYIQKSLLFKNYTFNNWSTQKVRVYSN